MGDLRNDDSGGSGEVAGFARPYGAPLARRWQGNLLPRVDESANGSASGNERNIFIGGRTPLFQIRARPQFPRPILSGMTSQKAVSDSSRTNISNPATLRL